MESFIKVEEDGYEDEQSKSRLDDLIDTKKISIKEEINVDHSINEIEITQQLDVVKEEPLDSFSDDQEIVCTNSKDIHQSLVIEGNIKTEPESELYQQINVEHSESMATLEQSDTNNVTTDTSTLKYLSTNNATMGENVNLQGNTSLMRSGAESEEKEVEEETVTPAKFQVNMSAIESISKENQATELQSLDGLSVYDQATLEAGILHQVDEQVEAPAATLLEPGEVEETDMERQIRLGEMTPFGTTLSMQATPPIKKTNGLHEIEKYLLKQAELQGKRKRKLVKQKENHTDHLKRIKAANYSSKKSSFKRDEKKKKMENLGRNIDDSVPWTKKSSDVCSGEESGSEYLPSESEYIPSSDEERRGTRKEKEEKQITGRKRKVKSKKPYKIPEDWASDDSDWEYSDEEGNIKKNKRSKKELDDGDVDRFNQRIRQWERERRNNEGLDEEVKKCHEFDGGYWLPLDMWDKLYNYQRVGVRWLWELDRQRCGGILGDEMGLGKTIQVIAFLAGLHVSQLKDKDTNYRGLGPTLIVCPTTVMHQWVKEFHTWYPPLRVAILHDSGTFCGKQRSRLIGNIVQAGGVLITSYTGATQHKEEILTRRWHYVVLDEGHKIRNPDAQVTLTVKQLRTSHRIILSGSPMQNNLKELWSLFDFVFPGMLGTLPVFLEQFAVPITQGGYANASKVQVMTAFKCATVLKDSIAPYLLRRMKADVKSHINLPEKNEQVLFCRLTDEQRDLYKSYVESGEVSRILEGRLKIFTGLIHLRKICNHPDLFSGGPKLFAGESEDNLPLEERFGYWAKSGKMIVVETLLKLWKKQSHRVLIFTQSRQMLAIMEGFLRHCSYSYLKLDGNTSIAARQPLINKFNQDTSYFVMLLTTRVGGLGVNLTGANRVLIYDPDWNPATDTQARERAWRIGQKQSVTVYRLITAGTIEEKMYHRQIFKQFLCNKVLKDPRQRRFFKSNDLFELFTLKETDVDGSTETAAIFAGTNSEVKLDPTKTYKHRKVEPRLEAKPPAETFSRKKAEKKKMLETNRKESSKENVISKDKGELCFSNEKIEQMKKLAQMLSKKIVKISPEKSDPALKTFVQTMNNNSLVTVSDEDAASTANTKPDVCPPSTSREPGDHKKPRPHKHNKKRKHKGTKFEGETVSHLVKTGESVTSAVDDNHNYATQDEYVLQKLFAKSGLQTAMQHDTIMEGGPADYALVEGEADRVAKQAVDKLRESRRECWRPTSGVPTFTGVNGARNFQPKPRFGSQKSSVGGLSSSQLLEVIRKRNGIVDAKDSDLTLVMDVREFVSSQGGTVNTNQLISRFEGRLAEGSSPLFKSLLSKICTFYRAPDKLGYWTLKDDFNW